VPDNFVQVGSLLTCIHNVSLLNNPGTITTLLNAVSGSRRNVNEIFAFGWDKVEKQFLTDVSGQSIGPNFKGQAVQDLFIRGICSVPPDKCWSCNQFRSQSLPSIYSSIHYSLISYH